MENEHYLEELEHLRRQLAMTVSLKFHLMPDAYPAFPDLDEIDIYADQIGLPQGGGDFFDYFRMDSDHIGIVVADIFDGGDAAALYMIAFKLYLMAELSMDFTPVELISTVNNRLASKNEDSLCLSAWFGVYELSTGKITAVNGGHEAPILLNSEGVGPYKDDVTSSLLAVMENMPFESYDFTLEHGDILILYTDGVTKAGFTEEMICDVISECSEDDNSEDIVGSLQDAFFEHVGEDALTDDATFLCVRRGGK